MLSQRYYVDWWISIVSVFFSSSVIAILYITYMKHAEKTFLYTHRILVDQVIWALWYFIHKFSMTLLKQDSFMSKKPSFFCDKVSCCKTDLVIIIIFTSALGTGEGHLWTLTCWLPSSRPEVTYVYQVSQSCHPGCCWADRGLVYWVEKGQHWAPN